MEKRAGYEEVTVSIFVKPEDLHSYEGVEAALDLLFMAGAAELWRRCRSWAIEPDASGS